MFQAKIIEDSVSEGGVRLTTLQLCYPRFIHAEAKTHRIITNSGEEYEQIILTQDAGFMSDTNLSRNASSSRAIPVVKMIKQVRENPAMPIHWGKNQPGMQAREEHNAPVYIYTELPDGDGAIIPVSAPDAWRKAAENAADIAESFMEAGYHKQVVNRLLEPFQWMHVIVTATEWDNFFELRDHTDADPNIQLLAKLIREAMNDSVPKLLKYGEWHLPYVQPEEKAIYPLDVLKKLSTARNARVSYLTHDLETPSVEKDIQLHENLVGSRPLHSSPTEHIATPYAHRKIWDKNFRGWYQYRSEVERVFS